MLVVFEGMDRCGKSTQAELLLHYLEPTGRQCLLAGAFGTSFGGRVRELFMEQPDIDMNAQLHLLASAMCQLVAEIDPVLKVGGHVVLDRFVYSTYAYHGYGLGVGVEQIRRVYECVTMLPQPDRIFLLDAKPEKVRNRRKFDADRVERMSGAFQGRARQGYLKLAAEADNWSVLDASRNPGEIHANVLTDLRLAVPGFEEEKFGS